MRATIGEALGLNGDPEEVDMLERKIEALNNKMLALVNESVSSGDGIEAHESEFMTLSQDALRSIPAASWKSSSVAVTLSKNPSKRRRLRDHPSFSFFISSWMFF